MCCCVKRPVCSTDVQRVFCFRRQEMIRVTTRMHATAVRITKGVQHQILIAAKRGRWRLGVPRIPLIAKFTAEKQCNAEDKTGPRCVGYSIVVIFRTQQTGEMDDAQQKYAHGCIAPFRCKIGNPLQPMLMIYDPRVVSAGRAKPPRLPAEAVREEWTPIQTNVSFSSTCVIKGRWYLLRSRVLKL
jgi:hypothetical protein